MNESEFERELRQLRPVAPSSELENRIAAELTPPTLTVVSSRAVAAPLPAQIVAPPAKPAWLNQMLGNLSWACAGAAAAVIVLSYADKPAPEHGSTPAASVAVAEPSYEVSDTERRLVDASDEGVRYIAADEPVRQVRYSYVDRYEWTDPSTGARVEVEVPREDVTLMPLALQ